MRRRFVALVATAALMAGCGGGGTPPAEYATGVCTAMGDWFRAIFEGGQILSGLDPETTPEEGKQILLDYLDDVVAATDTAIAGVEDTGAPDVEGGADVHARLVAALEASKTAFEDGRTQAEDVPTDDPEAFEEATTAISDEIDAAFTEIGDAFEGGDVPAELEDAFTEAPACADSNPLG